MKDYKILSDFLEKYGYSLKEEQTDQLECYYNRLIEANKVMNLTAITEFDQVLEKHFLDSAAIISAFDIKKVESLADVGTGAGFPGLPLKILFPHLRVLLADSLQKRVNFLNSLIEELKLTDISVIHGRAEDIGHNNQFREKYDVVVSRAVARLSTLTELCLPLVKREGYFLPYKTENSKDEIKESEKAIEILGAKLISVEERKIGPSELNRSFPIIKKTKNTPIKYPRKAGTPSKKPL